MVVICKSSDKKIHCQCIYILDIRLKSEVLVDFHHVLGPCIIMLNHEFLNISKRIGNFAYSTKTDTEYQKPQI